MVCLYIDISELVVIYLRTLYKVLTLAKIMFFLHARAKAVGSFLNYFVLNHGFYLEKHYLVCLKNCYKTL